MTTGKAFLVFCICAALLGCARSSEAGLCQGSPKGWRDVSKGLPEVAIVNRVTVSDSALTWNSKPISSDTLTRYLSVLSHEETLPFVILSSEPNTKCGRIAEIRDLIDKHYRCSQGSCGQI